MEMGVVKENFLIRFNGLASDILIVEIFDLLLINAGVLVCIPSQLLEFINLEFLVENSLEKPIIQLFNGPICPVFHFN